MQKAVQMKNTDVSFESTFQTQRVYKGVQIDCVKSRTKVKQEMYLSSSFWVETLRYLESWN